MVKSTRTILIDVLLLGFFVWLIGYLASILLYSMIPPSLLGWTLSAIFAPIAIFLCYKRFAKRKESISYYVFVAIVWLIIAVIFDWLFIVKLFNSQNYYKLDVYVYYASTFLIPFLVGAKTGRR